MADPNSGQEIADLAAKVAYNIASAHKRPWPYAHLMPPEVLPPSLFAEMRALRSVSDLLVPAEDIVQGRAFVGETEAERHRFSLLVNSQDRAQGKSAHPILDRAFDILSHRIVISTLVNCFRPELHSIYRTDALPLTAALGYFENDPGYELLPHTDTTQKVITLLIYLADDDAHPELGTELFALRPGIEVGDQDVMRQRFRRNSFLHVATAPYRPNQGLAFAPGRNTFHGVGKVTGVDGRLRRALQFQLLMHRDRVKRVT
ncbi:MAG: hypothetical protein P1U88_17345 [Thalassobaculaceae bacterium]|nr:hypothetical protein [Thalassobaculaceae bacterium]